MSQLSFACFFDQAKATAPLTPAKPVLPAVNAPTIPHRMMTTDEARRQFVSVFRDTARNLRRWEVFSDFITLAASELDMARIRTPENIEHSREICSKYSESDISKLHALFCVMVCALEAKFHDFLGAIFMELELGDDRNGQYFTPYHVQSLLARLLMPDVDETIRREGFVTVSDPASGAAGMIVAYAEYLLEAGYNPSEHMLLHRYRPCCGRYGVYSAFTAGYSCGGGHGQYADDAVKQGAVYAGVLHQQFWKAAGRSAPYQCHARIFTRYK